MKVVIAPDKFRGSLTAPQAASAIARGVRRADPSGQVVEIPMADGGEGTVEALVASTAGTFHEAVVSGPLGDPATARFGLSGDGSTAFLEMASASGLALVPREGRDPLRASTRGTGELVLTAIVLGASRVVLGIGGSASTDGGAGFAQALGFGLFDEKGCEIGPGGGALDRLSRIEPCRIDRLRGVALMVACDVDNPLFGPRGAPAIFGPQKGADPGQVDRLDANLRHFARIVARDLGLDVSDRPGSGAAGGLGAGLLAFTGASLRPGVEVVAEAVGLDLRMIGADLVLTGEGAIDGSSAGGKTIVGVGRIARSRSVPVVALAGSLGRDARDVLNSGIDAYVSLCSRPLSLEQAIAEAPTLLADAAEQVTRIVLAARRRR